MVIEIQAEFGEIFEEKNFWENLKIEIFFVGLRCLCVLFDPLDALIDSLSENYEEKRVI